MSQEIPDSRHDFELTRRDLLKLGALAGAGASLAATLENPVLAAADDAPSELNEATVAHLQDLMARHELSAAELVDFYLERIQQLDQGGPVVNSVIEINPDAKDLARALDRERAKTGARGPLHGIPVLLKDNIDTHDRMQTTAGSLALVGTAPLEDATVAARLRRAGAVILGKSTLSEWANFRSFYASSGWSARGGQCNNPYALDWNPCGSSSGSGAAPSANFTAVSIGSETDGSIVCPANNNGVVGIKPTVGLVSRAGVVPISHTQDTLGPHTRTVADAAAVLGALTGVDARDPATARSAGKSFTDYTQFLDPNGLRGARIGVARSGIDGASPKVAAIFDHALQAMQAAGALLVDVAYPHLDEINGGSAEITVLLFEFRHDLNEYLARRVGVHIHSLADAIAFNDAHVAQEMPFWGQEIFLAAEATLGDLTDPTYQAALARDLVIGGSEGIDLLLQQNSLQAIVSPTGAPAWPTDLINGDRFIFGSSTAPAIVGYPIINVPMGFSFGLPVGISFIGTAFSEATLIKLASGFEHVTQARRQPKFLRPLPFNTKGMPGGGSGGGNGGDQGGGSSSSRARAMLAAERAQGSGRRAYPMPHML